MDSFTGYWESFTPKGANSKYSSHRYKKIEQLQVFGSHHTKYQFPKSRVSFGPIFIPNSCKLKTYLA